MTTALILLPFGGALVVWLLPWSRYWAGSFGLLVALAEVGLWIETLIRFDFSHPGLQLFLTGAIVGVFAAQDLLLFYAFFEAMLIPLYVLVGVWGGAGRLGATIKLVIYTLAGSLLMLAAVIALGVSQGTFDLVDGGTSRSTWIFLGFAA